MPVHYNNQSLPRIKVGEDQIYRVYKGDELVWGLYNIKYNVGPGSVNEDPKYYVWGIGESNLPTPSYIEGTFQGWCNDISLSQVITLIPKESVGDYLLYAKVVKQKTQYKVHYKKDEGYWETVSSGGDFWRRTSAPSSGDANFTMTSYGGNSPCVAGYCAAWTGSTLWNCVGYVWGRWAEMGHASDATAHNLNNGPDTVASSNSLSSTPNLGAVAVWSGHVAIVEAIDGDWITISQSAYRILPKYPGFLWGEQAGTLSQLKGWNGGFQGFVLFPGGSGGSQQVWHENWKYYETNWQDSASAPDGEVTSIETRIVYSYWDYNTNNWSSWSASQI